MVEAPRGGLVGDHAPDVQHLLDIAAGFQEINLRPVKKVPTLKGKTVRGAVSELSFEVRLRSEDTGFVAELAAMTGVQSAVLVSYNGDYMN